MRKNSVKGTAGCRPEQLARFYGGGPASEPKPAPRACETSPLAAPRFSILFSRWLLLLHFHFYFVTCISGANENLSRTGGIDMNEWSDI